MNDKTIIIKNRIKQELKIRVVENKFIEIIIYDYSKKNIKTFYTLLEGEQLKQLKAVLK